MYDDRDQQTPLTQWAVAQSPRRTRSVGASPCLHILHSDRMGWPHCFGLQQARELQEQQQHHQASVLIDEVSAEYTRKEPSERDKAAAEALKKEGNSYFAKAKYAAATEVLRVP